MKLEININNKRYESISQVAVLYGLTVNKFITECIGDVMALTSDDPYMTITKRFNHAMDKLKLHTGELKKDDIQLIPRKMVKKAKIDFKDAKK